MASKFGVRAAALLLLGVGILVFLSSSWPVSEKQGVLSLTISVLTMFQSESKRAFIIVPCVCNNVKVMFRVKI